MSPRAASEERRVTLTSHRFRCDFRDNEKTKQKPHWLRSRRTRLHLKIPMLRWLGKDGLARGALLALALVVSLGLWPYGGMFLPRRSMEGLFDSGQGPAAPYRFVSPPVLYRTSHGELHAWDWRDGHSWRIPLPKSVTDVAPAVGGTALGYIYRGIDVIDVRPPHKLRSYPRLRYGWSGEELLLVTRDERLVVFRSRTWKPRVCELATGEPIERDGEETSKEIFTIPESDEFEKWAPAARTRDSAPSTVERWKFDHDGKLVSAEPRASPLFPGIKLSASAANSSEPTQPADPNVPSAITSRDGLWAAVASDPSTIEIHRAGAQGPQCRIALGHLVDLGSCFFSSSGDAIVVFDPVMGDIGVWESATGEVIAKNRRSIGVAWWIVSLVGLSLAGIIAGAMLWRCAGDNLTAAYFDVGMMMIFACSILYAIHPTYAREIVRSITFGVAVMIGIYWSLAQPPLFYRAVKGAAGLLATALVLTIEPSFEIMFGHDTNREINFAATMAFHWMAAMSAGGSVFLLRWFDLRIGTTDVRTPLRGFQFDVGTIMVGTALIGALIGSAQALNSDPFYRSDLEARLIVLAAAVAWFAVVLGMFTGTREEYGCGLATLLFLAVTVLFVLSRESSLAASLIRAALGTGTPVVVGFLLARRAGYRWVRTIVEKPG